MKIGTTLGFTSVFLLALFVSAASYAHSEGGGRCGDAAVCKAEAAVCLAAAREANVVGKSECRHEYVAGKAGCKADEAEALAECVDSDACEDKAEFKACKKDARLDRKDCVKGERESYKACKQSVKESFGEAKSGCREDRAACLGD